jgi:short-subunit dehydrogenase
MRNRVVLITGASSGIGAAAARMLAESSRLVLVARREDRLRTLEAAIEEMGGEAEIIPADLTQPGEPERVVAECCRICGGIDAVVNNAGVFLTAPCAEQDPALLDLQLTLNLRAPMLLTKAAIPHLAERGGGWIVNISSVAADAGFPDCGAYAATKAGLEAWSRSLREELRAQGIRVGVIVPGATDTEVWPEDCPFDRERMARAEDVARCIVFVLNSPPSASIDRLVVTPPGGAL